METKPQKNPFHFLSLVSGIFNPAQLGTNLALDAGIKTGQAAVEAVGPTITNTVESIKTNVGKAVENTVSGITKSVSGFTLNLGLAAIVGILIIGLFMRVTK